MTEPSLHVQVRKQLVSPERENRSSRFILEAHQQSEPPVCRHSLSPLIHGIAEARLLGQSLRVCSAFKQAATPRTRCGRDGGVTRSSASGT